MPLRTKRVPGFYTHLFTSWGIIHNSSFRWNAFSEFICFRGLLDERERGKSFLSWLDCTIFFFCAYFSFNFISINLGKCLMSAKWYTAFCFVLCLSHPVLVNYKFFKRQRVYHKLNETECEAGAGFIKKGMCNCAKFLVLCLKKGLQLHNLKQAGFATTQNQQIFG